MFIVRDKQIGIYFYLVIGMNVVQQVYNLRGNFVIVGLTGKTGAGCTHVATVLREDKTKVSECLKASNQKKLSQASKINKACACEGILKRAYWETKEIEIVQKFLQNTWSPFEVIKVSNIILLCALVAAKKEESSYCEQLLSSMAPEPDMKSKIQRLAQEEVCKKLDARVCKFENIIKDGFYRYDNDTGVENEVDDLFLSIEEFKKEVFDSFVKEIAPSLFKVYISSATEGTTLYKIDHDKLSKIAVSFLFKEWGNQIRQKGVLSSIRPSESTSSNMGGKFKAAGAQITTSTSGELVDERGHLDEGELGDVFCKRKDEVQPSRLGHYINIFVKIIHNKNKKNHRPTRIVIDKFNNPFEVLFFKERYSTFFLFSINSEESKRLENKQISQDLSEILDGPYSREDKWEELSKDAKFEMGYQSVDVNGCIEVADVHALNNFKDSDLSRIIYRYIALILHPGLLQPTNEERVMQVAYVASLNSGCVSRQVGAVVTDKDFSVKSIGWNAAPEGQFPCTMRCLAELCNVQSCYMESYSKFERNNKEFHDYAGKLLQRYADDEALGGLPTYYCFKDVYNTVEGTPGNQVHTRSLHAEENAFLQLAKYGTSGIKGGYLFTTDQCCVLCAKKAFQLGIEKIYYIDSYTDISPTHIIECVSPDSDFKPELVHYSGVVGGAYAKLYLPFFPQKDEILYRTKVDVKDKSGSPSMK